MKNIQCPVGKRIRSNSSLRWRTKKRARGRRHEKKKGGRGLVERGKEGRGEDFEASAGLGKLTQIGWIVNAPSCAAASALRKISPPFHPRVLSALPPPSRGGQCDFEIWIGAGDGQNLCLQRSASRERGKRGGGGEKFPGCFLLFYPPFFRFFGFSFLFFFRVLVVNSCGWDFCSFCFLSFFFFDR